jgi:hypothetical protein
MLNGTQPTGTFPVVAGLDGPFNDKGPIIAYARREAAAIQDKRDRLANAQKAIPAMQAELDRLTESLLGARQFVADSIEALPLQQEALELLCAKHGVEADDILPAPAPGPMPPAWPNTPPLGQAPIGDQLQHERANSPHCPEIACGGEMQRVDNVWVHTANGSEDCPQAGAE